MMIKDQRNWAEFCHLNTFAASRLEKRFGWEKCSNRSCQISSINLYSDSFKHSRCFPWSLREMMEIRKQKKYFKRVETVDTMGCWSAVWFISCPSLLPTDGDGRGSLYGSIWPFPLYQEDGDSSLPVTVTSEGYTFIFYQIIHTLRIIGPSYRGVV